MYNIILLKMVTAIKSLMTVFSWYPPGHGDIYESFNNCGLLTELINQGKEYVFISNIDNLGATVDMSILYNCHQMLLIY